MIKFIKSLLFVFKIGPDGIDKLIKDAETDPLTELLNRRGFLKRVNEEIEKFNRHGETFSLILIDLDDLKKANDNIGYEFGDELIKGLSNEIIKNLRRYDFAARIGGDEFVIILPLTKEREAEIITKRLREKAVVRGSNISFSAGVVEYSHNLSIDDLLSSAANILRKEKNFKKQKNLS
jgi:diguanylate cyclase (GGDEF)-like protein